MECITFTGALNREICYEKSQIIPLKEVERAYRFTSQHKYRVEHSIESAILLEILFIYEEKTF
jgi:hypothetical protein